MRNNPELVYIFLLNVVFSVLLSSSEYAVRGLKWLEVKSELAAEEIKTSPFMNLNVASAKFAI